MLWGAGRLLLLAAVAAVRSLARLSAPVRTRLRTVHIPDFSFDQLRRVVEPLGAVRSVALPRPRARPLVVALVIAALAGPGTPLMWSVIDGPMTSRGPSVVGEVASGDLAIADGGSSSRTARGPLATGHARRRSVRAPIASKRHALVIGINRARGGRPLPGSQTDATNLRNALLRYGFPKRNVTVLLEGAATRGAILRQIESLAARTPRDGVAVFGVATHTRRRGGQNELLTADGARISASTLGSHLGAVRSKMWVALPTCYAAGYAVPGIVGKNRIATFASTAHEPTYQLGNAGSYLMINMVRKAMLERRAPESVETAFRFAKKTLEKEAPDRLPSISDGIRGDLVLGNVSRIKAANTKRKGDPRVHSPTTFNASGVRGPDPAATPRPTATPYRYKPGPRICGTYSYNCRRD